MVLRGRIELPTSPLPRECSTTELPQPVLIVAAFCHMSLRSASAELDNFPCPLQMLQDRWGFEPRAFLCYRPAPPVRHNSPVAGACWMNPPENHKPPKGDPNDRKKARLAEKLRANLQRRKVQARSRRDGAADSRPEGLLRDNGDEA